ncbi:MAG: hypothetical protein PHZ19_08500 [Candidatus Thermoplasmatota archaeon]|nr:hypothetical protein [Candidatus Thermoplasmatota archaeon]
MPNLRPYLGWGFAGLNRKLNERLLAIESEIKEITVGEFLADKVDFDSESYSAKNVADALNEIAGSGRTDETVKDAYDLASTALQPGDDIPAENVTVESGVYGETEMDLAAVLTDIASRLEALEI